MKNLDFISPRAWRLIFVGLWLIRTCFVLYYAEPFNADAVYGYIPLGCNLVSGHGYSQATFPPYVLTAYRMPGYPLFLGLFYCPWSNHPLITVFIQCLIEAATVWTLFLFAKLVSKDLRAARLSALFFLLYPFTIKFTGTFFRDGIFGLSLLLTVYFLFQAFLGKRRMDFLLFCLVATLSIYFREDGLLFLGLFLLLWLFWHGSQWKKIGVDWAVAILTLVVLIGPWSLRNYLTFHQWIPLSSMEFATINWPRGNLDVTFQRTQAELTGHHFYMLPNIKEISSTGLKKYAILANQKFLLPLLDLEDARMAIDIGKQMYAAQSTYSSPEQFKEPFVQASQLKRKYLGAFPGSFTLIVMHRFFHYLFAARTGDLPFARGSAIGVSLSFALHFILVLAALIGLWRLKLTRPLIVFVLPPYLLMATSGWPEHRYALPILPFMFLGAAILSAQWSRAVGVSRK